MITNKNLVFRKAAVGLGLVAMLMQAHAEIVVILPESGPMARAGLSIKQGIMSAYQATDSSIPLKFVNSDEKTISEILKKDVNKKTDMIIGPLARPDVEAIIKAKPKIPVLALNEVDMTQKNVWQFSLSKRDDALALIDYINHDQVKKLYVVREPGTEAESLTFLNALNSQYMGQLEPVDEIPRQLDLTDGLALLGTQKWINSFRRLPKVNVYTQAIAVEETKPLLSGIKFCDVPALYSAEWKDVLQAYKQNPTTIPFQRLYAFGGDAWHIAEHFVLNPKVKNITFSGRTGNIQIVSDRVDRTPKCFISNKKSIVAL